jgi:hypothetical protein
MTGCYVSNIPGILCLLLEPENPFLLFHDPDTWTYNEEGEYFLNFKLATLV